VEVARRFALAAVLYSNLGKEEVVEGHSEVSEAAELEAVAY
jgi:hypothetical protein